MQSEHVNLGRIAELAANQPGLELLALHGSRARNEARPDSDWDFAFIGNKQFQPADFLGKLMLELKTEAIDLADLDRAGGLLRFRVTRDGQLLFEHRPELFIEFCIDASSFWCDAGPIFEQAYADILAAGRRIVDLLFDRPLLAERTAVVERHLRRVTAQLPDNADGFVPMSDATDAVILHLWQATQVIINLANSATVRAGLGTPAGYADAFRKLGSAGFLDKDIAARLVQAAGFRNIVAHAYDDLDMGRVYRAARYGPADLRAFLHAAQDWKL